MSQPKTRVNIMQGPHWKKERHRHPGRKVDSLFEAVKVIKERKPHLYLRWIGTGHISQGQSAEVKTLRFILMKNYIAYRGKKFQIEWYYDIKGDSQVLEYADDRLTKVEKGDYYFYLKE